MTMRAPSRRDAIALAAGALGAASLPDMSGAAPATSLAAAARAGDLVFGSSGGDELLSDAPYRALFAEQAAILVPEHALKFDALQPQQGRFEFAPADALIDGARAHGLMARGHTLFWNDWPPPWLKALSRAEAASVFDRTIDTVVPHFAGRLQSWDVVNEPFWLGRDKPGTFRPGVWYDALGEDYIFRAFRRTAALDRHAKLVLNEAWTERTDPVGLAVRASLLTLIDRIQDKGLRLDAVGLQGHLTPKVAYDDASFADFLHEIARRKVEIYITEFDVDDASFPDDIATRDKAVADRAHAFLRATLAVPAVTMVVTWGLSDRYSWWRDPSVMAAYGLDHAPRPLPYDESLRRKPLWHAMAAAFRDRHAKGPAPD